MKLISQTTRILLTLSQWNADVFKNSDNRIELIFINHEEGL